MRGNHFKSIGYAIDTLEKDTIDAAISEVKTASAYVQGHYEAMLAKIED